MSISNEARNAIFMADAVFGALSRPPRQPQPSREIIATPFNLEAARQGAKYAHVFDINRVDRTGGLLNLDQMHCSVLHIDDPVMPAWIVFSTGEWLVYEDNADGLAEMGRDLRMVAFAAVCPICGDDPGFFVDGKPFCVKCQSQGVR